MFKAKLRLEMSTENVRKKHLQELEEKEVELEEIRSTSQKKVKSMEAQLEEEYSEKQATLRSKRELERKVVELQEMVPVANTGKPVNLLVTFLKDKMMCGNV